MPVLAPEAGPRRKGRVENKDDPKDLLVLVAFVVSLTALALHACCDRDFCEEAAHALSACCCSLCVHPDLLRAPAESVLSSTAV